MDMFQIEGARPLVGTVRVSGSKNACLPLLMAALLADEPTYLDNVPNLRDIREMTKLLEHLGAKVSYADNMMKIDPAGFKTDTVPYEIMRKMRASFYAMGPMLARLGRAKVSLPGGCAIGDRPVDLHLKGFKALGAAHTTRGGYIHARHTGLKGTRLSLMGANGTSVGATCNVMMVAALAEGQTIIDDAAREPEIVELGNFLNAMGAQVDGHGGSTIRITGAKRLRGIRWSVQADRIEAATYAIAGLITHGDVTLENAPRLDNISSTLQALETWGARLEWTTPTTLRVRREKIRKRPLTITTEPFPGFPTDIQAPMAALLCLTPGESVIRETIYPERFIYAAELKRLGAKIKSPEKGRIEIVGVAAMEGAAVMASDLRAGAALIVAALAAHGTSQVRRVYHVERGYERIEEKLRALGARITRLPETDVDPGLETALAEEIPPMSGSSVEIPMQPPAAVEGQ